MIIRFSLGIFTKLNLGQSYSRRNVKFNGINEEKVKYRFEHIITC